MRYQKKKIDQKRIRPLFYKIAVSAVGFLLLVLICFPLAKNLSQRYIINKEIEGLKQEISSLETKNRDLDGLISYLESESYIDEQARLKLNYRKEGEGMIVVKNDQNLAEQAGETRLPDQPASASDPGAENNFSKWYRYFFISKK